MTTDLKHFVLATSIYGLLVAPGTAVSPQGGIGITQTSPKASDGEPELRDVSTPVVEPIDFPEFPLEPPQNKGTSIQPPRKGKILLAQPPALKTDKVVVKTTTVRVSQIGGGLANPRLKQGGSGLVNAPLRGREKYRVVARVRDRKFEEIREQLSERIDDVHEALEEWGTLTLSGLLLAPPTVEKKEEGKKFKVGTFGIDINGAKPGAVSEQFNFDKWFKEAGSAEGDARITERMFNSFVGAGTLQMAPEQGAIADSFLQRQQVNQELFQEQLERNRVQRQAEAADASRVRQDRLRARELRIEAATSDVERATLARAEAALVVKETQREENKSAETLEEAEASLKSAPPAEVERLTQIRDDMRLGFERASKRRGAAETTLDNRSKEESNAIEARAKALEPPLTIGTPGATIAEQLTSPTLEANAKGGTAFSFASEITPGSSLTTFSSATDAGLPTATPTDLATIFPDTGQTIATLGNDADAVFPARARLIDAAGNQTIARIFDFLGNPAAALEFTDKPIIMAAGTITVNPGWRTTRDYDGQINCSAVYKWRPARRLTCERMVRAGTLFNSSEVEVAEHFWHVGQWPKALNRFVYTETVEALENTDDTPLAAAVSPLMERQNIDQASSRARQDEIALFLSASLAKSGQRGAADVFDKYIRLRRQDVRTRSALPVVNSYGLGGNRFGFSVTSRIQAIADINKGKAGGVLEKQNFPVLVVFGLSGEDLRPRLVRNPKTGAAEIWEPQIHVSQTRRWMRQKKIGDFHQLVRSIAFPGFPGRPMESPGEMHRLMNSANLWMERMNNHLKQEKNMALTNDLTISNFVGVAREDYDLLSKASFLAETMLDIPVEYLVGKLPEIVPAASLEPAIITLLPSDLLLNRAADGTYSGEVAVMGENLDSPEYQHGQDLPARGIRERNAHGTADVGVPRPEAHGNVRCGTSASLSVPTSGPAHGASWD